MRRMLSMVASGCLLLAGSALAGQVENPQYTQWAKFKPGTSTTIATSSDAGGQSSKMETKTTLKEVTPDKVVIESAMSMEAGGQKMDMPAQSQEIKKMMDEAPATPSAPNAPAESPKPQTKESEETVSIAGGSYKCKVTESTVDVGGSKTVSKTWTSDEVPGSLVKMEATSDGPVKSTTKMELKAFDKK
jgi:hypothetical protein